MFGLYDAASKGRVGEIRRLVGDGADVDFPGVYGRTPLFAAVAGRHADAVRVLLELGANPNRAGRFGGATALMEAAAQGFAGAIPMLLDAGADVDAANSVDWTALCFAVSRNRVGCVRALLRGGARAVMLGRCQSKAAADLLLPFCGAAAVADAARSAAGGAELACRAWLDGSHETQERRREMEAVLLDAVPRDMPQEISSLCGEYLHAGRLAAVCPVQREHARS